MKLFTLGHSAQNIEHFVELLANNGVTMVVDVRSSPYSRFHPQFNKEELIHFLTENGFSYVYEGKNLGGRPTDPTCYKKDVIPDTGETDYLHEVDYIEVMKRSWFQQGIRHLLELAGHTILAIMCSEEDPAHCHRHHLIARFLLEHHPEVEVLHIRGDGAVFGARSILTSLNEESGTQLSFF